MLLHRLEDAGVTIGNDRTKASESQQLIAEEILRGIPKQMGTMYVSVMQEKLKFHWKLGHNQSFTFSVDKTLLVKVNAWKTNNRLHDATHGSDLEAVNSIVQAALEFLNKGRS